MANRAERRAQAKANRRGVPSQYDSTRGRGRAGMIDEYQLQERSRRLQDGESLGPWKPSAVVESEPETVLNTNPDYTNPKMFKAPHSVRQWFRVGSWTLIALAIIAFFVVMWLPSHPMWLIATVSGVFIVGVVSLFFTAGDSKHNPNLDQNGTAV
ncbi:MULTISPECIES: tripartite tricarboxylate transporter TctB family protein [Bifidobacterium]|uniref:tripartite tricarboxylate transporter TctB family protein n=1 Tax=Bifidobacterium TaxID=1678 RepID=UPI001BDC1A0C|nr:MULTISPECIES: tripartite tricarboxylate transporter TctB family protein [Bifidobacterium]MBT1170348.1 tripartite tricarboxylate transporter TctB family protein [Bifidobacterium sp. SO4]MBW3090132.1 tripartite tricarboxylate transporter TctB family protein [Bifidobacterium miconisargentati]